MTTYRIHDRVELISWQKPIMLYTGTIIGTATVVGAHELTLNNKLIIRLDDGFWNEKKDVFISVMCVDADSIRSVE